MAEVFTVRVPPAVGGSKPSPCGKIPFHGGNCCSDFIYSRSRPDETTFLQPCDSQDYGEESEGLNIVQEYVKSH